MATWSSAPPSAPTAKPSLCIGAYFNQNKCAKSPRDHFIDPQTQATSFCMENDHEKTELLNYDTSIHGESTIQKGMVPGVQKCTSFCFDRPLCWEKLIWRCWKWPISFYQRGRMYLRINKIISRELGTIYFIRAGPWRVIELMLTRIDRKSL